MAHAALGEAKDSTSVTWMEYATDDQDAQDLRSQGLCDSQKAASIKGGLSQGRGLWQPLPTGPRAVTSVETNPDSSCWASPTRTNLEVSCTSQETSWD